MIWWSYQWVEGKVIEASKERLRQLASNALDVRHGRQLPFRLYGAIIGGKLSKDPSIITQSESCLESMIEYEMKTKIGSPHSTINKVMFATALDPYALMIRDDEEILKV